MEAHVALAAEKLFQIGPLPITNSILTTWLVTAILITFALTATKKITAVPQGLQNIAEIMIEKHRNGPTSKLELYFDEKKATFVSLERGDFSDFEAKNPATNF